VETGRERQPGGRPRGERTITALIEKRLDKEKFVADLIALAGGGKDIEPATQLGAMRLILGYVDGLPIARTEIDGGGEVVNIKVTYVQQQNNLIEAPRVASGPAASVERSREVQCAPCGPPMGQEHDWPPCADA